MIINTLELLVKNLTYKKMPGYLKSNKINSNSIAVSISDDGSRYKLIDWKNLLPYGHKVVKIILCKKDHLLLLVGHSNGENITYNDGFSKYLLLHGSSFVPKEIICKEESLNMDNKLTRLDIILDRIGQFGISSLTNEEKKELIELSKK